MASKRGFACMSKAKQRAIASLGGTAAQEGGKAHRFTRKEAAAAGEIGGAALLKKRGKGYMSRIGRIGGKARTGTTNSKASK